MTLLRFRSQTLITLHVFRSVLRAEDVDFVDFVDVGVLESQLRTAGKDSWRRSARIINNLPLFVVICRYLSSGIQE